MIVAESLRRVRWPAPRTLAVPPGAPAAGVVAAIARAIAPPLADDPAPAFLRRSQVVAFRRIVAALRLHGGALLAEPVGTGKTWIALAAASVLDGAASVIAPAHLRDQWLSAAGRAGIPVAFQSQEQWSRAPRTLSHPLVIVDESHRVRQRATRRYRHLAPALCGRRVLLLSATPVVNRLADAAWQLHLAVRDDALARDGVASLTGALSGREAPVALARLIVTGTTDPPRPEVRSRRIAAGRLEGRRAGSLLAGIEQLVLSPAPPVRALIRSVFFSALASSPAAFVEALAGYRHLLLQATDARRAGRRPSRTTLRRVIGHHPAQLVLWELLDEPDGEVELTRDDLEPLAGLLAAARRYAEAVDPKVGRLASVLADGCPTVVFVEARATVHYLRHRLGPASRIAWCTGSAAGVGPVRRPRHQVLGWFRPGGADPTGLGPNVLVTTDVAAEGLDLQGAGRIVHYDLPWTAVRLEQREGRAVRAFSTHASVEVVTLDPPASIEQRLRRVAVLLRKAPLPRRLGLGEEADRSWRWCAETAARFAAAQPVPGVAAVAGSQAGVLAAVEFHDHGGVTRMTWGRTNGGPWTNSPAVLERLLAAAATGRPRPIPARHVGTIVRSLSTVVHHRAAAIAGAVRRANRHSAEIHAALRRIRPLALEALRRRDRDRLDLVERGLRFVSRGHTAGERCLVVELGTVPAGRLAELLSRIPPSGEESGVIEPRLVGLVVITFDGCRATAPSSSTSTGPCSTLSG